MMETIDFDREPVVESKARRPMTELERFGVKLALVLAAALIFFYAVAAYVQSRIENSVMLFKGGPVFWAQVEKKLDSLADEPDLPDQKKAQVIETLKKLSAKYRPYIDALSRPDR